jgi:hypothetical protein
VIDFECAVAESKDDGDAGDGTGLTLAGLVDVFSRKGRDAPPRWRGSSGPLRLADLKDVNGPKTTSQDTRKQ